MFTQMKILELLNTTISLAILIIALYKYMLYIYYSIPSAIVLSLH